MMPHLLLFPAGAMLGAFLAFAPAATADEPPKDERVCGVTKGEDGTVFRWCINMKAPTSCGPEEGLHCDEAACWCGDANATTWPGHDRTGFPLIAREAQDAGHECTVATFRGGELGDCRVVGWICDAEGGCRDSVGHGWLRADRRRG